MNSSDTIFALASAQGRAGVAVVRISGPDAKTAFDLCAPTMPPKPREAVLRNLHNPRTKEHIDRALILWFPAPHSFTGEDVVELHLHGGRAIVAAVAESLSRLKGFRLAEPGEFTRRGFENGKFDLTEAEAIADLVNAETEAQRRQAMRQFEGELGRLYDDWRGRLTKVLAYLEANIDFSDEDIPENLELAQTKEIRALIQEIGAHLDDRHRGERLREGFSVAILGPPNAGKSSLLNALARREAAIVSSTAGTTRDVIEVHLDLSGYPVVLADTAGLRESKDAIENEGVRRALKRAENADLKLLVFDGETWPDIHRATSDLWDANTLAVLNKSDQIRNASIKVVLKEGQELLPVSAKTGAGLTLLLERLIAAIDMRFADNGAPALTRERHRAALEECRDHLQRSLGASSSELRAEDIRLATRALGRITGRVDVENLLDIVFRDFCIGK